MPLAQYQQTKRPFGQPQVEFRGLAGLLLEKQSFKGGQVGDGDPALPLGKGWLQMVVSFFRGDPPKKNKDRNKGGWPLGVGPFLTESQELELCQ